MAAAILIVQGDRELADRLAATLDQGHDVAIVTTGRAAIAHLAAHPPDVVVVDDRLPDMDGLDCAETIRVRWPALPIIVTADAGGEAIAVEALQRGATDYLLRHDDYLAHFPVVVRAVLAGVRPAAADPDPIIGASPAIAAVIRLVDAAARQSCPVLVEGESGTGKAHIARAIHARSGRGGPLIVLNCAAVHPDVLELELARANVPHATLYVSQPQELSPRLHEQLYRLVARDDSNVRLIVGTYVPLGEIADVRPEVRAALERMRIHIPPLRERREDIEPLAAHFLAGATLDPAALQAMGQYDWPGNVRELSNMVQRGMILAEPSGPIDRTHLPSVLTNPNATEFVSLGEAVRAFDAALLRAHLFSRPRTPVRVTFDRDGVEGAISEDGRTASCGGETTFAMVRASRARKKGRWYVELTLRLPPGAERPGEWTDAGIVLATLHPPVGGVGARRILGDELADGDVIGLAIDLDDRRLYVRRNGVWIDGAPGDASAGLAIGYPGLRFVVAVSVSRMEGSDESDAWTANFGAKRFVHALPPGYRSYDRRQAAPAP